MKIARWLFLGATTTAALFIDPAPTWGQEAPTVIRSRGGAVTTADASVDVDTTVEAPRPADGVAPSVTGGIAGPSEVPSAPVQSVPVPGSVMPSFPTTLAPIPAGAYSPTAALPSEGCACGNGAGAGLPATVGVYEMGHVHQPYHAHSTHHSLYHPFLDVRTSDWQRTISAGRWDSYTVGTRTLYPPQYSAYPGGMAPPPVGRYGVVENVFIPPRMTYPVSGRNAFAPPGTVGSGLHQSRFSAGGYGYPYATGTSFYSPYGHGGW